MAGTFSQIYIQVVFAVKGRESLIQASWEAELYKYISRIIQNKEQKLLAINGMPDHIHILIGIRSSCCLSDLVREIKKSTNEFIKERQFTAHKFSWQDGFGAFSYGHSQLSEVIGYINRQKEHHGKKSFRQEYKEFLLRFNVAHEEKYLFEWIE